MQLVSAIHRNISLIENIFRFIIYILLIFVIGYQIYQQNEDLKILSRESSVQAADIPFPGVTVCPPFVTDRKTYDAENLRDINITKGELYYALMPTCPNLSLRSAYMTDVKLVDTLLKISPDFDESIYECRIDDFSMFFQASEKLLVRSVTDYGICYTFNMLGHDSVFNQEISNDFDTFKRTKISKSWKLPQVTDTRHGSEIETQTWSLETGYVNDDEYIQPVRASKMTTFFLKTKSTLDKSLCVERDRNYKMILHLPSEMPQITYEAIDILLGEEQTVMISAEVADVENSMKDLSPETRGCYFESEKPLKFFKSYTKANCEYECMTYFVYSSCRCVKFSMPRTEDMKVCMFYDYGCVNVIVDVFPKSYYKNSENMKNFPDYPCGCLPSCTEIKYKVVKVDKKQLENGKADSFSTIKVIFTESQLKKTSHFVTNMIKQIIIDVGSSIGLFLGLVTVIELFLFICKVISKYCRKVIRMFYQRIVGENQSPIENPAERFESIEVPEIRISGDRGDELYIEDLD